MRPGAARARQQSRRRGALALVLLLLLCLLDGATTERNTGPARYLRGVNAAGAEFTTGADFDSDASFAFYASRGYDLMRIPLRWESVQPVPGEGLDPGYLARLDAAVRSSTSRGMTTIIDIHNYDRYDGDVVGGGVVTTGQFADLWTRLAGAFRSNALVEFGLMNEPHDVPGGSAQVEAQAQAAVTAIRATGATNFIRVPGDAWSSAATYAERHPRWWVKDPLHRSGPEGHYYFDVSNGRAGTYPRTFADDDAAAREQGYRGVADQVRVELGRFVAYCRAHQLRGLVGEIGWPNDRAGAQHPEDARAWNLVAEAAYETLDAGGMDVTYWAAGEQWGSGYDLSLYTGSPQGAPTSAAAVVEAHRSAADAPAL